MEGREEWLEPHHHSSPARGRWRGVAVSEGEVSDVRRHATRRLPPPPPSADAGRPLPPGGGGLERSLRSVWDGASGVVPPFLPREGEVARRSRVGGGGKRRPSSCNASLTSPSTIRLTPDGPPPPGGGGLERSLGSVWGGASGVVSSFLPREGEVARRSRVGGGGKRRPPLCNASLTSPSTIRLTVPPPLAGEDLNGR